MEAIDVMPIYEYGCTECGKHIEAFQKITDEPLTLCPDCGGELSKLISSTSFVLKGGGWYADGYSSSGDAKGSDKPASDSGTPAKSAEAKPEKSAQSKDKPEKAAKTPVSSASEK